MIKPILFNDDMVRAILDGRKTVTRRIVKPQPINGYRVIDVDEEEHAYDIACGNYMNGAFIDYAETVKSPYWIGDILYVRETFGRLSIKRNAGYTSRRYVYKATDEYPFGEKYIAKFNWKPSIHMPKEAARIWLEVTGVEVERLQDITVPQCEKEGIYDDYKTLNQEYHDMLMEKAYPATFSEIWNSTIKKSDLDKFGWNANPWVWVIEFKRCEKPDKT